MRSFGVVVDPQIFITYSSKDQKVAGAICTALENRGLACWISSRNVKPGQNFQEQIVKAIRVAKIMVLVFTANANNSNEIKKELALASQNNLVVIPVRIEDVVPNEAFAYEFATRQWIDLFGDWEDSIARLVELIASTIDDHHRASTTPERPTVGALGQDTPRSKLGHPPKRALLIAAVFAVVLIGSVGVWFGNIVRPSVPSAPIPVQPPQTTVPAGSAAVQPPPIPAQAPVTPVQPASSIIVTPLSPDRERALKPKDSFNECDKCPEMTVVPAGSFMMGAPDGEQGHVATELPQHRVTIAKPFAVGRFAVTFDEWDACVADGGCNGYSPGDQGWGRGQQPAINVSWDDANAYVAWLSKKTGKSYRLLSEAECEYVTRAGTTTPFWWGGSISTSQANYNGSNSYGGGTNGEYRQKTVPVNSFAPNPWGLYQVHGNVWDWVEDCHDDGYQGAPSNGAAWTSGDCGRHAIRGGSWHSSPQLLRSASRGWLPTDVRSSGVGFRVGRTI
jgi:formylglycine-generating enzyme required for sulfatase activity